MPVINEEFLDRIRAIIDEMKQKSYALQCCDSRNSYQESLRVDKQVEDLTTLLEEFRQVRFDKALLEDPTMPNGHDLDCQCDECFDEKTWDLPL